MAEYDLDAAEKTLKALLKQAKQQGRKLTAEREFAVETVSVGGTHRQFQEIARSVSEGDETVATGYQRQMIVAIKSLEAENMPGNVFRDGAKQIIDDIMKVVNADVLLSPEAKREVEDVASQLIRYAERRGQVHRRIANTSTRLAKRVYSSFADSLSNKQSILLRGLGYLLKTPERRQERAKIIAETRQAATEGAIGAREQGEYDPELMTQAARRLRGDRGEPTSPEGRVLVDIRDGITKLVNATERSEEEYQQKQEADAARAEEGQEIFKSFSDKSPSKIKTDTDTKNRTQGLIGSLLNLIPGMSSTMKTIETVSGVLGNLARFLGMGEFGSLAAFFGSAAFATAFAGIIAVGVVGAAWTALLSKWGELVGLRKKYKEEGNRKLAQSEIAQLKSEGVDMSFAENAATTGEMARAVANTRLTQGSITPEEWEKLKDRGVTPPKSGQGFTDEDALKYLEVRKELANEKLTGKSGALGTLQANMQVALGGEAVYAAERKRTMRHVPSAGFSPSTALPTYGATASGFVEGGDADIHEALPEGRTPTQMPAMRLQKPSAEVANAILYASQITGVDYDDLSDMARVESGYRPDIVNPSSKATGLFQFVRSTWNDMVKHYGKEYPLLASSPWPDGPKDPFANALAGALLYKDNQKSIGSTNLGDVYLGHFAGASGAKRLMSAPQQTPITSYFNEKAIEANRSLFFQNPKEKTGVRSVAQVRAMLTKKVMETRESTALARASTGLEDQRATTNVVLMAQAAPAMPTSSPAPAFIPYGIRPRDDSRDAFNQANAF